TLNVRSCRNQGAAGVECVSVGYCYWTGSRPFRQHFQTPRDRSCLGRSSVGPTAHNATAKDERSSGKGSELRERVPSVLQPKKKKGKVEVRPINLGTDYEYGVLNIHLIAYDMALAESYAQYVHNLCNHLAIKVEESYAMPTKTMEVLQLQEQGSKMFLDAVLTTHERVVQISGLSATFAEIFLEIIHSNLPEGVKLSVREVGARWR
uniref:Large ribosomal subunit protein mL48 n=1 Tax=Sus scrofa TaxID=9823 RepID=A0A8D1EP87_PIG